MVRPAVDSAVGLLPHVEDEGSRSLSLSEVKVRVGPVPTDWSLARVKDALFQIGQVDVAYVGKTATDGTHTCELYV